MIHFGWTQILFNSSLNADSLVSKHSKAYSNFSEASHTEQCGLSAKCDETSDKRLREM